MKNPKRHRLTIKQIAGIYNHLSRGKLSKAEIARRYGKAQNGLNYLKRNIDTLLAETVKPERATRRYWEASRIILSGRQSKPDGIVKQPEKAAKESTSESLRHAAQQYDVAIENFIVTSVMDKVGDIQKENATLRAENERLLAKIADYEEIREQAKRSNLIYNLQQRLG